MSVATFYPTTYGSMLATHTYEVTLSRLMAGEDVHTTQMCLINEAKDYDLIRIVNGPDDVIEIRNNHDMTYDCNRTDKELRYGHNFAKMWENGGFWTYEEAKEKRTQGVG